MTQPDAAGVGASVPSGGATDTGTDGVGDGRGGVDLQTFQVVVVPANTAPIITSQPRTTLGAGLPYEYDVCVQDADGHTKRLAETATAMTGIVGLIQDIAGQINLLALNATIEAARAGAAGRGFAVVASEVKALADQAARATGQINGEIASVQRVSQEVVQALSSIGSSVAVMRETVVATAAAIEEQSAVTRDLAESMQSAAGAVTAITGNIGAIVQSVANVSQAVDTTRDAAKVLAR